MKALRTIVALIALVCIPFAASLSQDSGRRRRESDKREAKAERRNAREHRHRARAASANTHARLADDEDEDERNARCEADDDGDQEEDGEHQDENRQCVAPPPPPPPAPPPVPPPPVPPPPQPPPPPPPPTGPPPTGPHHIDGLVYQEVDGLPGFDVFAGDLRVANVAVELSWNGQLIDSKVSDADGAFSFHSLGVTTYNVCVITPSGFRLVEPAPGGPCGGNGYVAAFVSTIETGFPAVFGFVVQ